MKKRLLVMSLFVFVLSFVLIGAENNVVRFSTTTSVENSGLLSKIVPPFEENSGYKVEIIAVGTGKALKLGENGDVDGVFVHAREAELKFVAEGFGVNRREVMHNDFVILGPKSDPAGLAEAKNLEEALSKLFSSKSNFVSRGDDSGTHKKELAIWSTFELIPEGDWYIEAGQGMGAVITMANEMQAYTLADRGTYLSMKDKINLGISFSGDKHLDNYYGIMAVNPEKHEHVNFEGAMDFINWVVSEEAQTIIGDYKIGGENLFIPDAINEQ